MTNWEDIPPNFRRQIARKMHSTSVEKQEIVEEFNNQITKIGDKYGDDSQFDTMDKKRLYAARIVWGRLLRGRVGGGEYEVIPIGYTTVQDGPRCNVLAYVRKAEDDGEIEFTWLFVKGEEANRVGELNLFSKYEMSLNSWKDGYVVESNLIGTPERIGRTPEDLLDRLDIPEVKCGNLRANLSKTKNNWPVRTDWRRVQGTIIGEPVSKGGFGIYKIADETYDKTEVKTKSGDTYGPGISVFVHPAQMLWRVGESVCDFYGTVSMSNKTGLPTINAHLIRPFQAIPKTKSG